MIVMDKCQLHYHFTFYLQISKKKALTLSPWDKKKQLHESE